MNHASCMLRESLRVCLVVLALPAIVLLAAPASGEEAPVLTFERDVRPILKAHCLDCHGGSGATEGNLDLRLRRLMVQGGESGAAITPGKPEESYLLARLESGEMPPGDVKVPPHEIDVLRRWIAAGAPTARPEPEAIDGIGITPEEREHWAYRPIERPPLPAFGAEDRVETPIDAFLAQRLKEAGLTFSPEADRLTLIRRASFDLRGLPPARDEVAAFLADTAPDAYERMLDRLLASPQYGERWARHWLDVAGYADSEGANNADAERPYVYKYRDYVIRAFNADKPFDQFIQEQLAGDEMVPPPYANLTPEQIEKLTATGFLRLAADGTGSGPNTEEARNQVIADTLKNVSNTLLGVSVACAQCHDHRYDPISQADYFRMRAVFEPAFDWKAWRTPVQRRISLFTDADRARSAEIEAEAQKIVVERNEKQAQYMKQALDMELAKFEDPLRTELRTAYETPADRRTPEQKALLMKHPSVNISPGVLYQYLPAAAEELKKYDERIAEVRTKKPVEDFLRALTEVPGHAPPTRLFHRGDYRSPKQEILPGGLRIASPPDQPLDIPPDDPNLPTTGRRLAYARWLTDGRHPLVGRAIVNRIWMHHFGRGLAGSPSEFGKLGETPSHPELLDWLAREFMDTGWSVKRLHKLIMTSTAYRQSSQFSPAGAAADADNRLLWRGPVRRLEAEALRDSVLTVSGVLNLSMYGPAIPVAPDDTGQTVVKDDPHRRGVYVQVRRTQPAALLSAFDAPDMLQSNCERRDPSTAAGQSLMLLNSQFIIDHAARLAARLEAEAGGFAVPPELVEGLQTPAGLASPWRYGYGRFDESSGFVTSFQPLPHWTGSAWQGGPQLPDPNIGWVLLHAAGGHTGNNPDFAAIRRWTAPRAGRVSVAATLSHGSPNGDGVRGRVVSSRRGVLGEWVVHNNQAATTLDAADVEAGETLDFVVDCRGDVNSDSFAWPVTVKLDDQPFASAEMFSGPVSPTIEAQAALAWELAYSRPITREELQLVLDFVGRQMETMRSDPRYASKPETERRRQAITNLAQTLLGSNEFLYVD